MNNKNKNNGILNDLYKSYLVYANNIKNWQNKSKTDLANGFIQAEKENNNLLLNSYFATLMLKYWYMIPYLYKQNKCLKLEIEEYVALIEDSLRKGLSYRRWLDKSFEVSKDKDGAEKVFNRCIWSVIKGQYKFSNFYNNKINYETLSLDELKEKVQNKNSDCIENNLEQYEIEDFNNYMNKQNSKNNIKDIVEYFIYNEDYIGALIVDLIAYGECFKNYKEKIIFKDIDTNENIEVKNQISKFEPKKIISLLNKLNVNDIKYYKHNYLLNQEAMKQCLSKVSKIPNSKLYEKLNNTLLTIKNNNNLLSILLDN